MSDPTMHNRLYHAGWRAYVDGKPADPANDPVVREYTTQLRPGDQLAADIAAVWEQGFADARAETPAEKDSTQPAVMSEGRGMIRP